MSVKITLDLPEETWERVEKLAQLHGKQPFIFIKECIEKLAKENSYYEEINKKLSDIASNYRGSLEKWNREDLYD